MNKIAFIFPGQGSQKVGMGKEFYDDVIGKEIFDKASEAVELDLKKLCFEENDKLNITEYTQVCLLTTCVAIMETLKKRGIKPDVTAGLSLGEYTALVAAGAMDFVDAVKAVRNRGILMQDEVPVGEGAMAAILTLDASVIEESIQGMDQVQIANYNCPGQIVISGKKTSVELAVTKLKEAGAKRCLMLNVSGPFHSSMLAGAGEKLKDVLDHITVENPCIPYVANVTANYVKEREEIKPLLVKQVSSSVRWEQSIRTMMADGVKTFIEIGPGKTLAGFNKKIDKEINTLNVEKLLDIDTVVTALNSNS